MADPTNTEITTERDTVPVDYPQTIINLIDGEFTQPAHLIMGLRGTPEQTVIAAYACCNACIKLINMIMPAPVTETNET